MTITLTLPFPPKQLSPNARVHWAVKARAAKTYRHSCWAMALEGGVGKMKIKPDFELTFHPPDRRARDKDNMIAAFKAGQDGLADALQCDDKAFDPKPVVGEPMKGGAVVVRMERI